MVVHHDDPINKFDYAALVRAPWWMGPPETRPPGVPRETAFRPVITFIITLIDLKNGMNSKPGQFVRQGHDYRIELREAVQRTYVLPATDEQAERIERPCATTSASGRRGGWSPPGSPPPATRSRRSSPAGARTPTAMDLDGLTAAELARGDTTRPVAPSGPPLPVDELA